MWSKNKNINSIIFVFLFLTGFGFLGRPSVVMLFTLVLVLFSTRLNIILSRDLAALLVFCVLMFIFGAFDGLSSSLRVISFVAAFIVGNTMSGSKERNIKRIVLAFSFAMAMHVIINFAYDYIKQGNRIMSTMNHFDLWSESPISVTGLMTNATCFCAIIYYLLIHYHPLYKRFLFSFLFIAIISYDVIIGGRALMVITLVCAFCSILIHLYQQHGSIKRVVKFTILFSIVAIIVYIIVNLFLPNIISFLTNTYFFRRFGDNLDMLVYDTRFNIMLEYYKVMLIYPFGGGKAFAAIGSLPHELWLEIFNIGGLFPYLLFVMYSLRSFFRMVRFSIKRGSSDFIILFLPFTIGLFLQFFIEPVFSGAPVLVILFFLIDGILANKNTINYEKNGEA